MPVWLQVRLVNVGSKHTAAEMAPPAQRPTVHGVKGRSVRSVALFETDAACVTELIPSWRGGRDENADCHAAGLPEITVAGTGNAIPATSTPSAGARNLQQLRQVLREVGGRKVQQEALMEQQEGVSGQPSHRKARCDKSQHSDAVCEAIPLTDRHGPGA